MTIFVEGKEYEQIEVGDIVSLIGKKIGTFLVECRVKDMSESVNHRSSLWKCVCECGHIMIKKQQQLIKPKNTCCKNCHPKNKKYVTNIMLNGKLTELYNVWRSMRQRTKDINCYCYKDYGGRGIKVCEEWENYDVFYDWSMKNGYDKNLTLDRINNDGSYEPNNCRWTSMKEQCNNRRNNVTILFKDKNYTLQQLADILGTNQETLSYRLNSMSIEEAMELPIRKYEKLYVDNNEKKVLLTEFCKKNNLKYSMVKENIFKKTRNSLEILSYFKKGGDANVKL